MENLEETSCIQRDEIKIATEKINKNVSDNIPLNVAKWGHRLGN